MRLQTLKIFNPGKVNTELEGLEINNVFMFNLKQRC